MYLILFTLFASFSVTLQFQYCVNETIQLTVIPMPRNSTTTIQVSIDSIKQDGYVYFFRNNRSYSNYQHPWYMHRVSRNNTIIYISDAKLNDTAIFSVKHVLNGEDHTKYFQISVTHCNTTAISDVIHSRNHYMLFISIVAFTILILCLFLFN